MEAVREKAKAVDPEGRGERRSQQAHSPTLCQVESWAVLGQGDDTDLERAPRCLALSWDLEGSRSLN